MTLPRVGSDITSCCGNPDVLYFNPRSPCGERQQQGLFAVRANRFQSTLPVWGATLDLSPCCSCGKNFNPRSPCGERPAALVSCWLNPIFQSTLPVWGATSPIKAFQCVQVFQSTLPVWGATAKIHKFCCVSLAKKWNICCFAGGTLALPWRGNAEGTVFLEKRRANLPAFSVYYGFAVRESRCPPANSCSCSQNAPPSFRTGYPGSKTAASPFLRP